jgi:hypothetical protein
VEQPLDLRDIVRRRYAADTWRRDPMSLGPIYVWNLHFNGDELSEMSPERLERIELSSLRARIAPAAEERLAASRAAQTMPAAQVQTIWRHTRWPDVLLKVDVFESASQDDARDLMVWLLAEFESPLVERKEGIGDVGFGERGSHVLLFTRANLVYLLRNIGRRPVSVEPVGTALDAHAISRPEIEPRAGTRAATRVQQLAADTPDLVEAILYDVTGANTATEAVHKFFAPVGEIRMSGGRIVYRGPRAGLEALADYELSVGRTRRRQ